MRLWFLLLRSRFLLTPVSYLGLLSLTFPAHFTHQSSEHFTQSMICHSARSFSSRSLPPVLNHSELFTTYKSHHTSTTSTLPRFRIFILLPSSSKPNLKNKMSSAQGANPTSLVPFEPDTAPTTLPPPYASAGPTPAEEGSLYDEDQNPQPPPSIHINNSTTIRGSHNVVASVPYETAHLLAAIMGSLRRYNPQVVAGNLQVRIDRGVNIVGDGNIVGAVGIRPRQPATANAVTPARVAPAPAPAMARKRKTEEQSDGVPEAKRVSMRARSCPPS